MENDLNEILLHKKEAKENLAKELKFAKGEALVGVYLNKDLKKEEILLIKQIQEALNELSINLLVLNDSEVDFTSPCDGNNCSIYQLEYTLENRQRFLESIDIVIHQDFIDLDEIFINGIIPVALKNKKLEDYNAQRETGNSFIYEKRNVWHFLKALIRSLETNKFSYDWKHLVRNAFNSYTGN